MGHQAVGQKAQSHWHRLREDSGLLQQGLKLQGAAHLAKPECWTPMYPSYLPRPRISLPTSHCKLVQAAKKAENFCYKIKESWFVGLAELAHRSAVRANHSIWISVSPPNRDATRLYVLRDANVLNSDQEEAREGRWKPQGRMIWLTASKAHYFHHIQDAGRVHSVTWCEKGHSSDISGLKRRKYPKYRMKGCSRKSDFQCRLNMKAERIIPKE